MDLIVKNDYPFLPTNKPHWLEWLKEYNGIVISPSSYIVGNELEEEYNWFINMQCAITHGIVREVIKEENRSDIKKGK